MNKILLNLENLSRSNTIFSTFPMQSTAHSHLSSHILGCTVPFSLVMALLYYFLWKLSVGVKFDAKKCGNIVIKKRAVK